MKLVILQKATEKPIGSITTLSSGGQIKKIAPGKWVPVAANKNKIDGLEFKNGFYFHNGVKISSDYEKAKAYAEKKLGGKKAEGQNLKIGVKVRIKPNAKSNGNVREHKNVRGAVATIKEIGDKFVKIVDDAGKVFQVNKMALEFAKSRKIIFNLMKSESLGKLKKLLIKILEKNSKTMLKSRAYPVGTKREWKGKKFIKVSPGKWKRFYEGKGDRGEKQAIALTKKKIMNATTIKELAKIVLENRKRFTNPDGSVHPVVQKLLESAKGVKLGIKPIENAVEKKEAEKEKSDKTRGEDKQKRKERSDKGNGKNDYKPSLKEQKAIDDDQEKQIDTAMMIDSKIESGEDVSELRNGENYYNEKPSDILNTGKEIYGVARHKFDTYEVSNLNLQQMEKDNVAAKMITKSNLLKEPGFDNFDEMVKDGKSGARILLENYIYKTLRSVPADDEKSRERYNNLCRLINRGLQETETAYDLYIYLSSNTNEYAIKLNDLNFKKDSMGTETVDGIMGKELAFFLHPKELSYMTRGSYRQGPEIKPAEVKRLTKIMGEVLSEKKGEQGLTESEAKKLFFGEKYLLEEKGIGKIKKGDKVFIKKSIIDDLAIIKTRYKSPKDADRYRDELEKVRNDNEEKVSKQIDDILKEYKKTDKYKKYQSLYNEQADRQIERLKDKYVKKDGSLSLNGKKKFKDMNGFKQEINNYKRMAIKNINEASLNDATGSTMASYKIRSQMMKDADKILREKYMTQNRIKVNSYEVVVSTASKDTFRAVISFEDGQKYEKMFKYDEVEKISEKQQITKGKKRKKDFYIETKAVRRGGTNEYESKSVVDIQKSLHDDFMLKSTTFGNSMTDKERAFHIQKTAESLSDLSDVLKLDKNVVSANGKLGIAYGAFGGLDEGGIAACYRPDQKLISLTRNNGFGSLAHEWMHFIDYMLPQKGTTTLSEGGGILTKTDKVPPVIPNGSILVTKKKNKSGKVTETRYYYDDTGNKNYPFIKLQKGNVKPTGNKEKEGRYRFADYSLKSMIENPKYNSMNDLFVVDQSNKNKGYNEKQKYASNIISIMQSDLGDQREEARKTMLKEVFEQFDNDYFNSSYYNNPKECLARGFEVYLGEKLNKLGRENTYLASIRKTKEGDGKYIYPQEKEKRDKIFNAFEKLFSEIRNSDDLKKSINEMFGV